MSLLSRGRRKGSHTLTAERRHARPQVPPDPFSPFLGRPDPGQMLRAAPPPQTIPFHVPSTWDRPLAPPPSEVIPYVPLTCPPAIYDALGGDTATAWACGHCGGTAGRGTPGWRPDALCVLSCPACQRLPGWRAPALPGVQAATRADDPDWYGYPESRLAARAVLASRRDGIRQRADGLWEAVIPVGGRSRFLGAFERREDAERVYGSVLDLFARAVPAVTA